ncbi:formyl-CoA transferase [Devosia enhydra]|uniref:Formyl-CoA transferase n=1 Tax=Devosia enhydra TaxID=665118 RepID=A0A1K2I0W6_9HYPH|nr:CaiB/BaiF CoA-transferase family protein [Devosia enhydra]SFZ86026.1 formyl-CoA transferase [Devosia enhydra]
MTETRPLEGIRVLDLSHVLAGPYMTLFLAQNGAEVIKIENPAGGDMARRLVARSTDGRDIDHVAAYLNRGKKGLALNLRSDEGKAIFRDLVAKSDIVVENFTPATLKRLGFGYEELKAINPAIIYTSLSGFGHDDIYPSPMMHRPAFNLIAQAMGGIMDITGEADGPPIPTGVALGDLVAGIFALSGTLLALQHRARTGVGQHVDISMYDCLASFSQRAVLRTYLTGEVPTRGRDSRENPLGSFKVKDGYVVMTLMGAPMWQRFCAMIDRQDLLDHPDLNPDAARGARFDTVLRPMLEEWAEDKTRDEVVALFSAADLPAAPVQDAADLLACEQLRARRMIEDVDDPVRGPMVYTGNPIKLSNMREKVPSPAPALGQDTASVLEGLLGLSPDRIAALRQSGTL